MHSFKSLKLSKSRLLGAGLVAVATLAGAQAQAQPPAAAAGPGNQPPLIQNIPGSGTSITVDRADFTIQINETFRLRHEQGGLIKEVLASRPGIVQLDVNPQDATVLMVKGAAVGVTQLTITATDRQGNPLPSTIRTVQVNPDISYIRSKVAEAFPTSNLRITSGGTPGSLIVTGWVNSAEEIDPIRNFLNGIAAQYSTRFVGGAGGGGGGQGGGGQGVSTGTQQPDLVTIAIRVAGAQTVQLDVCLASVNRQEIRRLGVDFFHQSGANFLGTSIGGAGFTVVDNGLPTSASTGANFVFSSTNGANSFQGFINALRNENLGKVLANPSMTCLSGRPSRFAVGGEEPYGTAGSGGGQGSGISFRPFGTVVTFMPVVLGEGRIRLTVAAENSNVSRVIEQPNLIAPAFAVQSVGTTLELDNGQSMVIGGLIRNQVTGVTNKYPILGDLPFVGTLFRSVSFDEREEELVIMVRVSLVDGLDCNQRSMVKLPGQETRSPSDFELFIEGILEAPRGGRDIFPARHYVPAFKNDAPFGHRAGECALPGPVCGDGGLLNGHGLLNKHGRNGCNDCAPGCVNPGGPVMPQGPAPMPISTEAAPPVAQGATEATAVPVESAVPVIPTGDAPKPPTPPLPPGGN
jgi:pilus assembly protein CpaC